MENIFKIAAEAKYPLFMHQPQTSAAVMRVMGNLFSDVVGRPGPLGCEHVWMCRTTGSDCESRGSRAGPGKRLGAGPGKGLGVGPGVGTGKRPGTGPGEGLGVGPGVGPRGGFKVGSETGAGQGPGQV